MTRTLAICSLMTCGDEYLTARINAEIAITEFVQEKLGFYVLAQIKNVHVGGVE